MEVPHLLKVKGGFTNDVRIHVVCGARSGNGLPIQYILPRDIYRIKVQLDGMIRTILSGFFMFLYVRQGKKKKRKKKKIESDGCDHQVGGTSNSGSPCGPPIF